MISAIISFISYCANDVPIQPIGLVMFSETNRNFTLFKKIGMYVHDIYVLPSHREQKVAACLVERLRAYAAAREYGRIDWLVLNNNRLGKSFFSSISDATKVDYIQAMRINLE